MSNKKDTGSDNFIGLGIKQFRKRKNLTLEDLANIINSSPGYLSEIERGIKIPGSKLIKSLKRNFKELDLNKLFLIESKDDPKLDNLTTKKLNSIHFNRNKPEQELWEVVDQIKKASWSKKTKVKLLRAFINIIDADSVALKK